MSTTTQPATAAGPRALPAEVYDLFRRVKDLEKSDGSWPGGDTVQALCTWFIRLGVDPDGALSDYVPAEPPATPEGTVYLVQRDTIDGLYLFADDDQAAEYAALFPGAVTGTQTIINGSAGAQLIIDNQPCPSCGEPEGCGPCPVGDPGCDELDCQNHDRCRTPIAGGTRVWITDEIPADPDGADVLTGVVAEPTEAEATDRNGVPGARVFVAWPHHRSWEDLADLTVIDDMSGLHW